MIENSTDDVWIYSVRDDPQCSAVCGQTEISCVSRANAWLIAKQSAKVEHALEALRPGQQQTYDAD